ncbi:BA14K family protein [Mesorhizobium sp. L-8-3]|uniref:BA14K family protein n=1 Tax=Mesorhizobium sp. L-8-3 TaxID=2744522 RepID=UPI0019283742|nr:BA14K family protein [Mesorhizobium sp. L-8-3]BCH25101.1 hypothetical protein MesoLjLb_48860 [Mesorhizobium sp. L-8-3]
MRKLLSGLCASLLAASFALSSAVPLNAAPTFAPKNPAAVIGGQQGDIQYVRDRRGGRNYGGRWAGRGPWGGTDMPYYNRGRGGPRYDGWRGRGWRGDRYWRGGGGRNWAYYNGYRGYRYYRPGYRYYNDYWFPGAAFIAGALITGAIANSGPRYYSGGGSAHERWCYNRYRSYRAWDNTFQPYNGPRRQCISPY